MINVGLGASLSRTPKITKRRLLQLGIASVLVVGILAVTSIADARTTKIEILTRTIAFGGYSFLGVGQYEKITGIATGEVDPGDPKNAVIVDIQLAPKLPNGNVQYRHNFYIEPVPAASTAVSVETTGRDSTALVTRQAARLHDRMERKSGRLATLQREATRRVRERSPVSPTTSTSSRTSRRTRPSGLGFRQPTAGGVTRIYTETRRRAGCSTTSALGFNQDEGGRKVFDGMMHGSTRRSPGFRRSASTPQPWLCQPRRTSRISQESRTPD